MLLLFPWFYIGCKENNFPLIIRLKSNCRSFGERHLRAVWRLSLGLGVIPALAVFIWRLSMDEPRRYKKDSMKHAKIPYLLILRRYGVSLAAISLTWFIYDFITYAPSYGSQILVLNAQFLDILWVMSSLVTSGAKILQFGIYSSIIVDK